MMILLLLFFSDYCSDIFLGFGAPSGGETRFSKEEFY